MDVVLREFVEILVAGIESLGSGIATGVAGMAKDLLLDTSTAGQTHLSVFGGIVAIFAGISLAVGITRFVMRYVSTLGN